LSLFETAAHVRVPRKTPLFEPTFRVLDLVRFGGAATSASGALTKVL
jgi:hypothetical protein